MRKQLWIFQKDTPREGSKGLPTFFFFDEKLELGQSRMRDFKRSILDFSDCVSNVDVHDFYIELCLAKLDINSVAKHIAETLAKYLEWSHLEWSQPPKQVFLKKTDLIKLRNQRRFDRKWNVKL